MSVQLNHTIVHARDKKRSAEFLARMLGLEAAPPWGPFYPVRLANGVELDFTDVGGTPFVATHYAFLVSEEEFDEIFGRIEEAGLEYRADPHGGGVGEINHHDGGRGVYWNDPDGHVLEIITRPYGSSTKGLSP
jgi:catechol 2,3-dioxygenase-like lactoylglutathione lyase family enzyme